MTIDPVKDAMAAGFQALLHGDTKERDRQVKRARKIMEAETAKPNVDIGPKQIIAKLLVIAENLSGRPLTASEQTAIERNPVAFMEYLISTGYKMPTDLK